MTTNRWMGRLMAAAALTTLAGCAQLDAGKRYTLAKIDRSGYLIEPNRLLPDDKEDRLDEPAKSTIELRLSDDYFRYLNTIGRPEVVMFTRVVIRDPKTSTDESMKIVYERIILNSEDGNDFSAGNQASGGSRKDVVILPAILNENQDIQVSIRVIELDQDDNRRWGQILNAAAGATAQFRPEAAATISVAQTALAFILANNPDDLEFSYDFGLAPGDGTLVKTVPTVWDQSRDGLPGGNTNQKTLVLSPRIGQLAILKTELAERAVYPTDKVELVTDAGRWVIANALKLGTLNLLNMWRRTGEYPIDVYSQILGDPLGVPFGERFEPLFGTDGYFYKVSNNTADNYTNMLPQLPGWRGVGNSAGEKRKVMESLSINRVRYLDGSGLVFEQPDAFHGGPEQVEAASIPGLVSIDSAITAGNEQMTRLDNAARSLEAKFDVAARERDSAATALEGSRSELKESHDKIAENEREIHRLDSRIAVSRRSLEVNGDAANEARHELPSLLDEREQGARNIQLLRETIDALNKRIPEQESILANKGAEKNNIASAVNEARMEHQRLYSQVSDAERARKKLGDTLLRPERDAFIPYRDKMYFVFSINDPGVGTPLKDLKSMEEDSLTIKKIRTTQLTPEEFGKEVARVGDSLKRLAIMREAKSQLREKLKQAKTPEEAEAIRAAHREQVKKSLGLDENNPEQKALLDMLMREYDINAADAKEAADRERESKKAGFSLVGEPVVFKEAGSELNLLVSHPPKTTLSFKKLRLFHASSLGSDDRKAVDLELPSSAGEPADANGMTDVKLKTKKDGNGKYPTFTPGYYEAYFTVETKKDTAAAAETKTILLSFTVAPAAGAAPGAGGGAGGGTAASATGLAVSFPTVPTESIDGKSWLVRDAGSWFSLPMLHEKELAGTMLQIRLLKLTADKPSGQVAITPSAIVLGGGGSTIATDLNLAPVAPAVRFDPGDYLLQIVTLDGALRSSEFRLKLKK